MTELHLAPDTLLFCIDDSGHEELAGHDVYGLGGCGILGAHFERVIRTPWREVRSRINGDPDKPLHAAKFGRNSMPHQKAMVADYFSKFRFIRIGAVGAQSTRVQASNPLAAHVLHSLKLRIIDVTRYSPFKSIAVVFEDSQRANPTVDKYFGDFALNLDNVPVPVELCFMPKRLHFEAMEVADFIANAVGGEGRRKLIRNSDSFGRDFASIFHNIDKRLVSFCAITDVVENEPEPGASPQAPSGSTS